MKANVLKNTRCYTIGAMEYKNGRDWREIVKSELGPLGVKVFDPYYKPFIDEIKEDEESRREMISWQANGELDKVHERMKKVRRDDLRLVDISDFFIVQIIPGVASWGSGEEFFWANRLKKPIFTFVEGGKNKCPLWVLGTVPPKYIFNSLEESLEIIKKIDSGEIIIDSERWNLLKPEFR